jgi:hypothetical protein
MENGALVYLKRLDFQGFIKQRYIPTIAHGFNRGLWLNALFDINKKLIKN